MNPTASLLSEIFSTVVAVSWRAGVLVALLAGLRWLVRGRVPAQLWFGVWVVVAVRLMVPVSVGVPARAGGKAGAEVEGTNEVTGKMGVPAGVAVGAVAARTDGGVNAVTTAGETGKADAAAAGAKALSVSGSGGGSSGRGSAMGLGAMKDGARDGMGESGVTVMAAGWKWSAWVAVVWLAGVGVLGVGRVAASVLFRRRLRRAVPVADERWQELVAEEARAMGMRQGVVSLETEWVEAPALAGWVRPQLLLPPGLVAQLSEEERRFVIRHELGHWRRRDLPVQALVQAAVVVHWFNPLAWVAARLARTDCELACDEFVLRRDAGAEAPAYGAALLKVLGVVGERSRPLAVVGLLEGRGRLADRVRRIADYRAAGVLRRSGGVALVGAVALLAAGSFTREVRAQTPVVTPAAGSVVKSEDPRAVETRAKIDNAKAAAEFLRLTVNAQKQKVEQLAQQVQAYKEKNQLSGSSLEQRKQALAEEFAAATVKHARALERMVATEIRAKQFNESREKGRPWTVLPFVANRPDVSQARVNLTEKRRAVDALTPTEGDSRPEVVAAKKAMAEAETEMERALAAVAPDIAADRQRGRDGAEQAEKELIRLTEESLKLDQQSLEYMNLERNLKVQEQILQTIAARAREVNDPTSEAAPIRTTATAVPTAQAPATGPEVLSLSEERFATRPASMAPAALALTAANSSEERIAQRSGATTAESLTPAAPPTTAARPVSAGRGVSISGSVNKVGRYALPENEKLTLVELIVTAGGLNRFANGRRVRVSRVGEDGKVRVFSLNVMSVLQGVAGADAREAQFELQPGDIVYVPEQLLIDDRDRGGAESVTVASQRNPEAEVVRGAVPAGPTVMVLGAVAQPGMVAFRAGSPLTLIEAISLAGSFNRLANGKRVRVSRTGADGVVKIFNFDVIGALQGTAGASMEGARFELEPKDIVYVPEKVITAEMTGAGGGTASGVGSGGEGVSGAGTAQVAAPINATIMVMGAVGHPGTVRFRNGTPLTLLEAISTAGSFTRMADKKRVKLTRVGADGKSETRVIDVDALMRGDGSESGGMTQEARLQAGDVVVVPERN